MPIRAAYGATAVLVGVTSALGNSFVGVNLPFIQGRLGLSPVQGAWLTAAYAMTNISGNLLFLRFRQQFGIRLFAACGLVLYAAVTLLNVVWDDYEGALVARALSGFATVPLSTLTIFYMLQAAGQRHAMGGLIVGLSIAQGATPLAYLVSPELTFSEEPHVLYLFESGLALCALAAIALLQLPESPKVKIFAKGDVLTYALLCPALALIVAVLSQGRLQWWPDHPWLAVALCASVLLLAATFFYEEARPAPLIFHDLLYSRSTMMFMLGAFGLRFVLSEQTYAASGLLMLLGAGQDQLQGLYAVILVSLAAGAGVAALTFTPPRAAVLAMVALGLVAAGAFIDADATNLVRPHEFLGSQALLGFANGLFFGPLLIFGVLNALKSGYQRLVTFVVLFLVSQTLGGLAGSAILGTFQQHREQVYSAQINAGVDPTDPIVAQRLQLQSRQFAGVLTDRSLQQAEGVQQLRQSATREANVRAYNDVFTLIGVLALVLLAWIALQAGLAALKPKEPGGAAAPAAGGVS
ncbi:MFS transporter [Sphingomonas bacterium]|uniref:MFS transporter n=1 Tax=Sphingomonas bacterium TaxID=1895847 RepID=UPI001575AF32|nr:MFS transporter [Sphingomonas bacterium]